MINVAVAPSKRPHRQLFYAAMAAAMAVITLVGFAPTYYVGSLLGEQAWPPLVHVHAAVFTAWIGILMLQAALVRTGHPHLHRRFGVCALAIALAMLPVGTMTAVAAARRGLAPDGVDPLTFLVVPLGALVAFAVLLTAAIAKRRRPEAHKRLVLLATFAVLTPALARLPGVGQRPAVALGLTALLVVCLAVRDWRVLGRLHPATLWGGTFLIASAPARFIIGNSDAWHTLAEQWIR